MGYESAQQAQQHYLYNAGTLAWEAATSSTVVTVSTGSMRVQQSSAADLVMFANLRDGSSLGLVSSTGVPSSNIRALVIREISTGGGASSTQVSVSTGALRVYQSTAGDLLMTASPAAGSTWATRPIQSSQADLRVTAYQSTAGDFNVTVAGYSTIATVSTGSVRVTQSTAGDLNVTVAGYSTITTVSTGSVRVTQSTAAELLATVTPSAGSTWSVRPLQSSQADLRLTAYQSTAGDLNVTVAGYSTVVTVSTVTGRVLVDQNSTTWAVQARAVLPTLASTGRSTTGNGSTRESFVSSVAGQRVKVYAYSITSTVQAINDVGWFSSNANLLWPIVMQSLSSGITGANLAVTPPAYLFATDAANALTFGITGSTGTYKVGVSYFQEA